MNFINRIKEIRKNKKKEKKGFLVKMLNIVTYAIPLVMLSFSFPVYIDIIKDASLESNNFIAGLIAFLLLLISNITLFPLSKSLVEINEDSNTKLTEKEINDFILSFPEQYHELVINNIAIEAKKNNFISLYAIKHLEEKLTEEKLKSDLEALYLTNLISDSKNIVIKKEEMQNEFQK